MKPEAKEYIEVAGGMTRLLLSGFAPQDEASIAKAIVSIAEAAALAHLAETGRLINESSIKPMEKLTPEDLPHAAKEVSPTEPVPADQVPGGEGTGTVQDDPVQPEVAEEGQGRKGKRRT